MSDNTNDRTDHRLYPGTKSVYGVFLPDDWPGDTSFLEVNRAGSKEGGYHYGLVTFSSGAFRFLWLTEDERRGLIESLGGRVA